MDYGKFKFEYQKKQKEQRKNSAWPWKKFDWAQLLIRVISIRNCSARKSLKKGTSEVFPFALRVVWLPIKRLSKSFADFAEAPQDIAIIEQRAEMVDAKCLCIGPEQSRKNNCQKVK